MSTKGGHMKTNLGHKLHQVKSYETLKVQDFHIFFLDDDNSPIQKVAKQSCIFFKVVILHV